MNKKQHGRAECGRAVPGLRERSGGTNEIMTRFCGHCGIKFEGTAEVIVELSLCHIVAEHPEEVPALMGCSDPVVRKEVKSMKSGYTLTADGPERASCADLPEIRPARFHKLGEQDIAVWGTRYTVQADTLAAIDYAVERLGLQLDTIQTPNEILDEAEYAEFKNRGGRG